MCVRKVELDQKLAIVSPGGLMEIALHSLRYILFRLHEPILPIGQEVAADIRSLRSKALPVEVKEAST